MGGLKDMANRYAAAIQKMKDDRLKNAVIIAGDALALVINRIQNKGIDADGGKFKEYYKEPVPIMFLRPGINKAKQERFEKDVKAKKTVASPYDWRRYMGLPNNFRNFTITGEMIRSFHAKVAEHTDFVTVVELRASDAENQQKLNGASFNMGRSILELNDLEKEMVEKANTERQRKLLNETT
jgi:hypothetical protein